MSKPKNGISRKQFMADVRELKRCVHPDRAERSNDLFDRIMEYIKQNHEAEKARVMEAAETIGEVIVVNELNTFMNADKNGLLTAPLREALELWLSNRRKKLSKLQGKKRG